MDIGSQDILSLILIPTFVAVVLLSVIWHFTRSRTLLERWAGERGYRLLETQRRWLRRGPFFFTTTKGQAVFRVTVEDREGNTHHGWVRVGGFLFGLLANRADARWDETSIHHRGFPVVMPVRERDLS